MQTIEVLPVSLLVEQKILVKQLRDLAQTLGLDFGWHYLLDLTWIISHLTPELTNKNIIDAGAGVGVLQWYLASRGANVISIDRLNRQDLALRFRGRFNIKGLHDSDLHPVNNALFNADMPLKNHLSDLAHGITGYFQREPGTVTIYHQDLKTLRDIADESQDMVVSVSALEHNSPEGLSEVVTELIRVLKPGGKLLATLCAAEDRSWFHEPSKGWCYDANMLRKLFDLPVDTPDNYGDYAKMMGEMRECAELRDNLARFYFKSVDNGMPWGKWDPQYLPVGVCKIK
jgi:SAM-dependent methyltransferase